MHNPYVRISLKSPLFDRGDFPSRFGFRLCEAQKKQLVSSDSPPILFIAESEAALAAALW